MFDVDRPPFDEEDSRLLDAYLASVRKARSPTFDPDSGSPIILLTTSLGDAQRMMEHAFLTQTADGQQFRGYPVFVEQPSPNAFAVEHKRLQICGINIGLVTAAYELSLFVFSQATMFREIGNAVGETSPTLPDGAALSFWLSDRLRAGERAGGLPVGAELIPKDGQRQTAALFLTLLMLRFVWLHELFHSLNGHTGRQARRLQGSEIFEISDDAALSLIEVEETSAESGHVEGYSMEIDADRAAFWALMQRQLDGEEPVNGIRAMPTMLRLRLTAFAATLMTFLFDQSERRRRSTMGGGHPIARDRLHNLVRTLASNVVDPNGQVKQLFAYTVVEMDYFQERIPAAISGSQLVRDLQSAELQAEFGGLEESLVAAREHFAPYAFSRRTDP